MIANKYYWLKLQNNFFEKEEIKILLSMPNGTIYVIIYLKMLLKSLETEGTLIFKRTIPYTPEMIASITNENIDIVRKAIDIFIKLNLMESLENGALFMNEIQNMVGSESKWAEIKRRQRKEEKQIEKRNKIHGICEYNNADLIENKGQNYMKCAVEDNVQELSGKTTIEKEKELEIKKNKIYMNLTFIDDIIDNVKITEEEYNKLIGKHGKAKVNKMILNLDNYIANGRKKYKDHYRVINTWCISDTKYNEKNSYSKDNKDCTMGNYKNVSHHMFSFD